MRRNERKIYLAGVFASAFGFMLLTLILQMISSLD